ncbi:MAG: glycoside hydrolase family 2 [Clostridiales bacterium]|nr:glycoside hydrolase family 2 [Clostridiales bacterium]
MSHIKTIFYDKVDKSCPLNEYPRPQFMRDFWVNLNGEFDYAVTNDAVTFPMEYQGKITVPFAIETALSGVERPFTPDDRLWYKKNFTLSEEFKNKRVILNFGAVDWECRVFINRQLAGSHMGGYNSFSFDITDLVTDGENELIVYVYDPTDKGWQQRGKQAVTSHGFWYTGTSGIWQTVWLEAVSREHIGSVKLLPDIDKGTVNIKTQAVSEKKYKLTAEIFDGESSVASVSLTGDDDIEIPDFKLWSPEEPNLYDVVLVMKEGNKIVDKVKTYFGMRKFSLGVDNEGYPRLFLNNKPYFQNGLLDQGYWCDGGLTPPTDEAMIYDIQKMKDLGFNMLRKHIKVEPARWYYHCDRLGMLVWQDMVSGGKELNTVYAGVIPNIQGVFVPVADFSMKDNKYAAFNRGKKEWRDAFKEEFMEMIDQHYNCVSICTWVPFNEGWGQFDALEIGSEVKKADPSRFVDHASGWYDQGGGDFRSIHRYILPVQVPKRESRPFVLSEFGGYSQIIDGHVWNKQKSFGYMMFKTKETLTKAYKKLYEKQIIPLLSKGLSAIVYTQVSDVEFEVNGIMTYDRAIVKVDESTVKEINGKLKF